MLHKTSWSLTLVAIVFISAPCSADFELSGTVQGKDTDESIAVGTTNIRVYRDGQTIAVGSTDANGQYRLNVPGEEPINRVTYITQNNDWHPWVVRSVSANGGDMRVPVLLMPDNGPSEYDFLIQQLIAYEELYYLTVGDNSPNTTEQQRASSLRKLARPRLLGMPELRDLHGLTRTQLRILQDKQQAVFRLYRFPPQLASSVWDTEYRAHDGKRYRSFVKLNGDQGSYEIFDTSGNRVGVGRLRDVQVNRDGKAFSISGDWKLGGSSGYFVWYNDLQDPLSFRGEWGFQDNNRVDYWNGSLK